MFCPLKNRKIDLTGQFMAKLAFAGLQNDQVDITQPRSTSKSELFEKPWLRYIEQK